MTAWTLAPGTHAKILRCGDDKHREVGSEVSASWEGVVAYAVIVCGDCSMARDMTDEELSRYSLGRQPPLRRPDTDARCTHRDAAGQCLDHQGHTGTHQWPAE